MSMKHRCQPCPGNCAPSSQRFAHPLEPQIVTLRETKPLISIRKWLPVSGADVASPLVPGDQFRAHIDDGHAHFGAAKLFEQHALGLAQHKLAETSTLQSRPHGKHAEVARVLV